MCKMSLLPLLPAQWACRGTDKICMTVCTGTNIGCTVMQTWTSTRTCRPQLLYIIGTWYVNGMDKVNVRGYFDRGKNLLNLGSLHVTHLLASLFIH